MGVTKVNKKIEIKDVEEKFKILDRILNEILILGLIKGFERSILGFRS